MAAAAALVAPAYQTLKASGHLEGLPSSRRALVVVLPQLGEFDSAEFCEQLSAVADDLERASIALRVIGIGNDRAAERVSMFTGLDRTKLRVDEEASVHRDLGLHAGPAWEVPDAVPDSVLEFVLSSLPGGKPADAALLRPHFNAWLNYLAMCAGIAAPGTLPEIARGYFGDRSAPERFAADALVTAGPVKLGPGVGPVKLGPIEYVNGWANEAGYQRPVELATVCLPRRMGMHSHASLMHGLTHGCATLSRVTVPSCVDQVRLRNMVEVLGAWDEYVSDTRFIAQRGATYLFNEDGEALYEYRHRGVLTYSNTMSRPLTFLAPFIGARALNPLNLGDMSLAAPAAD